MVTRKNEVSDEDLVALVMATPELLFDCPGFYFRPDGWKLSRSFISLSVGG
jgi:hypothetical protein